MNCAWCNAMTVDDAALCDDCFNAWPKCAIEVCTNKACIRLGSKYCWPHTPGLSPDEIAKSLEEEKETVHE